MPFKEGHKIIEIELQLVVRNSPIGQATDGTSNETLFEESF